MDPPPVGCLQKETFECTKNVLRVVSDECNHSFGSGTGGPGCFCIICLPVSVAADIVCLPCVGINTCKKYLKNNNAEEPELVSKQPTPQ